MAAGIPAQVVQGKDETGSATSLTLAGVNGALGTCITVDVHWRNSASQAVTDVTHNGVSIFANEIGTQLNQSGGSQRSFRITGSSLPSGSVVVTMSAAVPTVLATARVWPGVNLVTPITDVDTSVGVGTASTTPAVTAGDDDMIADSISIRSTPTGITVASGSQTESSSQSTAGTLHHRTSYQDGSAAGDQPGWTWTGSQNWTHKVYVLSGGTPAPTITNVDGDDTVTNEQQNVVMTGTDISSATVAIIQDGFTYSLAIDSQNATTVTADLPVIGNTGPTSAPHPGSATYRVTNTDAQTDTQAITITDKPDTLSVAVVSPILGSIIALQLTPAAATGDYVRWWITGGTFDETNITINADLTYDVDAGLLAELEAGTAVLRVQAWALSDGTWGDAKVIPFTATAVSTGQTPAGSSRRKPPRRTYVEIDGQQFEVRDAQEAVELLNRARALAEREAEESAREAANKVSRGTKVKPVKVETPTIVAPPEMRDELAPIIADIERLYAKAAQTAELRLLMQLAMQEEEDELLLLL